MLHVALWQPVIPQNVGNIARTCVGMGAHLHVVGPTIIDFSDKAVKRAGLDYWQALSFTLHPDPAAFFAWAGARPVWLVTKFGSHRFDQAPYADDAILLFGSEREGLPESVHQRFLGRGVCIPIPGEVRSYNLGNAVAIVLANAMSKSGLWPEDWAPKAGHTPRNTFELPGEDWQG